MAKGSGRPAGPHAALGLLLIALLGSGCTRLQQHTPSPIELALKRMEGAPNDVTPLLDLVTQYLADGDYLRARQYIGLADKHIGARAAAERIFRLAVSVAVRSQNYNDAIELCEAYLSDHRDLNVRRLLATLFEATSNPVAAERQRKLILLHHPEARDQLVELARFYERSQLPDGLKRARSSYKRYLAESPNGLLSDQVRATLQTMDFDARSSH